MTIIAATQTVDSFKIQRKTGTALWGQVQRKGYPTITKTFKLKKNADTFAREIEGEPGEAAH